MANETKAYGSVKRYGVRYGTKLKGKIGKIEAERRLSTKCPYCSYNKATRIASGIWSCEKCKSRFTGKAYTVGGKISVKEAIGEAQEAPAEAQEEYQPDEMEESEIAEEEQR